MEVNWQDWTPVWRATLMFVIDRAHNRVLLIEKKTGFGAGKVNGPGGKLEEGESYEEAVIREVREEVCLEVSEVEECGDLKFQFADGHAIHGKVFRAFSWGGEAQETEEAKPFWCDVAELPYERMWEDDQYWLPFVLEGKHFEAKFVFDGEKMLSKEVVEF